MLYRHKIQPMLKSLHLKFVVVAQTGMNWVIDEKISYFLF